MVDCERNRRLCFVNHRKHEYPLVLNEIAISLTGMVGHLRAAGIGQTSEIFDGDYPHNPRGCIAQAWSVSGMLRLAKIVVNHPLRRNRNHGKYPIPWFRARRIALRGENTYE